MDAAHKTLEIGDETQHSSHITGSDKGVASDKRCNIYNPTLDPSYNQLTMLSVQKTTTVHY